MSESPYIASTDSALLRRALSRCGGERCLEIGAGNAGNLIELAARFDLVVGTDLIRPGMSDWKSAGANFVLADSASCVRSSVFDLVAFNPPYIAAEVTDDRTTEGGAGLEVPMQFLREALRVVRRDGRVMILLNNEADVDKFRDICLASGFHLERIATERAFFEELTVYVASRPKTSKG